MTLEIILWLIAISFITALISRKVKLSRRYERAPREKSTWQKLDHGIDPSVDE